MAIDFEVEATFNNLDTGLTKAAMIGTEIATKYTSGDYINPAHYIRKIRNEGTANITVKIRLSGQSKFLSDISEPTYAEYIAHTIAPKEELLPGKVDSIQITGSTGHGAATTIYYF